MKRLSPEDVPVATVDVAAQMLTLGWKGSTVRTFRVSTSAKGVGAAEGSGKTPPGRHRVARLFGHTAVPGQVFVSRRAVKGHVIPERAWRTAQSKDYVLTRILWLEGLEPGVNRGPGIDSHARYIYIHGTNQEHLLGTPASHGCIRMANADVLELFAFAKRHPGLVVDIAYQ